MKNSTEELCVIGLKKFIHALNRASGAYLLCGIAGTLAEHPRRIFSSHQLIEAVYGGTDEPSEAYTNVRMAIGKLRKRGFTICNHNSRGYSHMP